MALAGLKLARHAQRNPLFAGYLSALTFQGMAIASANDALQLGDVSKSMRIRLRR